MAEILMEGHFAAIREMTEEDAPLIVSWRNQPEVARWLIQWRPLTETDHRAWFRRARACGDALFTFVLPDGFPFGTGSLYDFDPRRRCGEWGRLCGATQRGYGVPLSEACYLVHRLGFEALGLERLYCGCSAGNAAANRLNTWLGYVQEGYRRRHLSAPDGYRDVIEYGMLADEFARRKGEIERTFYGSGPTPPLGDAAVAFAEALRARAGAGPGDERRP